MPFKTKSLLLILLGCFLSSPSSADPVWVTGQPASRAFLRDVLQERGWNHFPPTALQPGESWRAPDGSRVINLDWQAPSAALAALSDHPEKVTRTGGLFFGGLTELRPLHLQYYHLGLLEGSSPDISLHVYNPGRERALIHLKKGVGVPSLDYFSTGHSNNTEWFQRDSSNLGEFLEIPAGETRQLFSQALPYDHVVSGTLGLTLLEGPAVQFALVARRSPQDHLALNNLLKREDVHSRGFYPAPYQTLSRTYRVGDPELHIAVGAVRQQTFSGVRELRGDYGVIYRAQLTLHNETASPRQVRLDFNPRGGAATGTFRVNGEILEIDKTEAFKKSPILRVTVPPNSQKLLQIDTLPEGASSYPVRIVVAGEES